MLRLHTSLEADAYLRLKRGILSSLWLDVDKRLEIIGVSDYFWNRISRNSRQLKVNEWSKSVEKLALFSACKLDVAKLL